MLPVFFRAAVVAAACVTLPLRAASWRELSPEDLRADAPVVDPKSSIEVLFKEVEIDNSNVSNGLVQHLYVRLKVFDARGVDQLRNIPLSYADEYSLFGVAARVVRPDGTATELTKDAFFDAEVTRSNRARVRRRSFVPPHLAPGDVVEFKASLSAPSAVSSLFITFQEPWPIREARIRYKPLQLPGVALRTIWSKVERQEKRATVDGWQTYEVRHVPARINEPFAPPESAIAPWLLILQLMPGSPSEERYWAELAKQLHKDSTAQIRPRSRVAAKAKELTAGTDNAEERLRRLYDFCRTEISNTAYDFEQRVSPEQRKTIQGTDRADEILARRFGNPHNVRVLFAALAGAAGFEARLAFVNDRQQFAFSEKLTHQRAMPDGAVAVKFGDAWRFFDPGSRYHDFGALRHENEAVPALVADSPKFERTPAPRPEFSREVRHGKLALEPDGTLAGEVRLEYHGHRGVELKELLDNLATEERVKEVERRVRELIPTAELSGIELVDVTTPSGPLVVKAMLRAPEFAERAGGRLFVMPGAFAKARQPLFTAAERITDIQFPYPWTEYDEVRIELPPGYELEQPAAPQAFDRLPFAKYDVTLAVTRGDKPALLYKRTFLCAGLVVPVRHYPTVKSILDEAHRQDQHLLTLKRSAE